MPHPPLYNAVVKHGPGVRARLSLNGVPFHYEKPKNFHGTSIIATHLLVPEKNTIGVEILEAPLGEPGNFVAVTLTKEVDPKEPTVVVHELHWPNAWKDLPERERILPFAHAQAFEIDHEQPPPPWEGAPPADIPLEGTPELHQAVLSVLGAFERRDATAFLDAVGPKLEDMGRYYPPHDGISRGVLQKHYEAALSQRWEVLPFDKDAYLFHSRQNGRVVYVTRADGEKALSGRNLEDLDQTMEADLVFVRQRGAWRVLR